MIFETSTMTTHKCRPMVNPTAFGLIIFLKICILSPRTCCIILRKRPQKAEKINWDQFALSEICFPLKKSWFWCVDYESRYLSFIPQCCCFCFLRRHVSSCKHQSWDVSCLSSILLLVYLFHLKVHVFYSGSRDSLTCIFKHVVKHRR